MNRAGLYEQEAADERDRKRVEWEESEQAPRSVSRGANWQRSLDVPIRNGRKTPVSIGIDWLRCTAPHAAHEHIKRLLEELFGPGEKCRGQHLYTEGLSFAHGARLFRDATPDGHSGWSVMLELGGEPCGELGLGRVLMVLDAVIANGGRCRRLDVAADFRAEEGEPDIKLIDRMEKACLAGELTHARVFHRDTRRQTAKGVRGGIVTGDMLTLGSRQGSGRYGRCYDKGLESGQAERGRWVRFETEFTHNVAEFVAIELNGSWVDALERNDGQLDHAALVDEAGVILAQRLFGAFDFRSGKAWHVDRKKRAGWWSKLLGDLRVGVARAVRKTSTVASYGRHLGKQLRQAATMAEKAGESLMTTIERIGGVPDRLADARRPAVKEYLAARGLAKPVLRLGTWADGWIEEVRDACAAARVAIYTPEPTPWDTVPN
ncbi:MAG: replication initiation factor domain-containing protein [Planctomycetota bacterium]